MQERERLGSRLGFILLSAGCAIGLGNVYRFPIWTGAYGGGVFLLFYLIFLILLGIPVMTTELSVGRASQRSIATSFDVLEKPGQKWHWMKALGVAGNYLLMMFYTTISGWFLIYFVKYLNGSIMEHTTAEALGNVFGSIVSNPGLNIPVTILVIVMCFGACAIGLQKGVEKITKVMMVLLLVLILGLGDVRSDDAEGVCARTGAAARIDPCLAFERTSIYRALRDANADEFLSEGSIRGKVSRMGRGGEPRALLCENDGRVVFRNGAGISV